MKETDKLKSIIKNSEYFDEKYYLEKYSDVKASKVDPYEHYLNAGAKENRIPSYDFDPIKYCEYNQIKEQINPIIHYETEGKIKGYKVYPTDYKIIENSKYFDKELYLFIYNDIKKKNIDPIEHYITHGWKENRIPSLKFDPIKYINDNNIIDINPVIHYEIFGKNSNIKVPCLDIEACKKIGKGTIYPEIAKQDSANNNSNIFENYLASKDIVKKISNYDFKHVKILYISTTSQINNPINDGSTRYRCFHPAEALEGNGAMVAITTSDAFLKKTSYDYDVYIFHRPNAHEIPIFRELKKYNKILIADYDDLIFGTPGIAEQSSIVKNQVVDVKEATRIFNNNLVSLNWFDNFSVTTQPLAEQILNYKSTANVNVVQNFIPKSILTICQICKNIKINRNKKLIMYCSGTNSHNLDFATVSDIFANFLKNNKDIKLYIFGVLNIPTNLRNIENVYFHPPVDYWTLFKFMRLAGYTIAPLEDSLFNRCKSYVKFIESAVSGNYLIATSIPDMKKVSDAKISLFDSPEEWKTFLNNGLDYDSFDPAINLKYVENNCSHKKFTEQFVQLFKGIKI